MSRSSTERKRQARRDEYQATKPLKLAMGILKNCFENAMEHVFARPERLVYVEGFYTHSCTCCVAHMALIHHGWVLDKVTGRRHEVTLRDVDKDAVYIGKEFTRAELKGLDGRPLDDSRMWTHQLTMQDQFDMLTAAGHDVQLIAEHWRDFGAPDEEWLEENVVDLNTIDMSLSAENAYNALVDEHHGEEGWGYRWEVKADHNRWEVKADQPGAAANFLPQGS